LKLSFAKGRADNPIVQAIIVYHDSIESKTYVKHRFATPIIPTVKIEMEQPTINVKSKEIIEINSGNDPNPKKEIKNPHQKRSTCLVRK
jgi:hypothetical protein